MNLASLPCSLTVLAQRDIEEPGRRAGWTVGAVAGILRVLLRGREHIFRRRETITGHAIATVHFLLVPAKKAQCKYCHTTQSPARRTEAFDLD